MNHFYKPSHHRTTRTTVQWKNRAAFDLQGEPFMVTLQRTIDDYVNIILNALKPADKTPPACKYYGHKIGTKTWAGAFPNCADCGHKITNPSQLRRATLAS